MFMSLLCGRTFNKKINTLHERALRMAYNDYTSSFMNALLDKDSSVTIHQRNLRCLAIEMLKINNKLSQTLICDLIHVSNFRYHT